MEEWANGSEDTASGSTSMTPSFITIQSGWYSFIFTLGFIGNLYIILTVYLRRARKSATNIFIVNLAISDLLVLLLCLPQSYITDHFSWPFGKIGCQLLFPLSEVFFTVSILTLTVITIERHRAIVHPFKSRFGPKLAKGALFFVWLVSYLAVGLPLTFIVDLEESEDGNYRCQFDWSSAQSYRPLHTIFIALVVLVPLLIIAYGYAMIIFTMRKQSQRIKKRNSNTSSIGSSSSYVQDMHTLDENKKLVKLLVVLVVVFWICMTPLVILALVAEFGSVDFTNPETVKLIYGLYTFTMALFFTNSAFNPVAIYIMSSEMRKGFYEVRLGLSGCGR